MSLIYGTGSFTRFKVDGDPHKDYLETLPKIIARYAFRSLDENSEVERSTGWVNIMDQFDNKFAGMEYFKEPCIALSWRVDIRQVPAKALKQYSREEEEKIKESEGLEHLSKKRRQDIKEAVRIKLMKRVIPRSNAYDTIWNLKTRLVIFGSTSNKISDEFSEFFLQCFGLHLKAVHPHALAVEVLEREGMNSSLLDGLGYSIDTEVH